MATVPLHTLDLATASTTDHFIPMQRPDGKGNTAAPGAAGGGGGIAGTGVDFGGQRERVVHVAGTASVHSPEPQGSLGREGSDASAAAAGPSRSPQATRGTLGEPPLDGEQLQRKQSRWQRRRKSDSPQSQRQQQSPPPVQQQGSPPAAAQQQQQQRRSPYQSSQQGTPQQSPRRDSELGPLSEEEAAALRLAAEEQEAAQQERQQQVAAEAATEAAMQRAASGSAAGPAGAGADQLTASGSGGLMGAMSGAMSAAPSTLEHLVRLAANPLEALRSKRCVLHVRTSYLPLTAAEVEAMAREHSRQRRGGRSLTRRGGTKHSGRVDSLMNRWGV